jgi:HEPN domain-containing protein
MMQLTNETLLSQIIEKLEPDWMFAKDDFLLIVLSQKIGRPLTDYKAILQSCVKQCREIAWIVLYANELERYLNEGHLFYSALCKKEYLLYCASTSILPLTLWQKTGKIVVRANACFLSGHQRASSFLDGAVFFCNCNRLTLSLFMLHQATEQVMRCFILALMGQDIRTHSLNDLRQQLSKYDFKLSSFLSSNDEQHLFTLLDNAYSASRYMDSFICDADEIAQLLYKVKTFLHDVEETFTRIIVAVEE